VVENIRHGNMNETSGESHFCVAMKPAQLLLHYTKEALTWGPLGVHGIFPMSISDKTDSGVVPDGKKDGSAMTR
jgi:hypothetical protein